MIKIIQGVYGYRQGHSVIPKTSKDEPFSLDEKEEKRLVNLGVAEFTDEVAEKAHEEVVKEETPADNQDEKVIDEDKKEDVKEELDKAELIARYKELGLGGNPAAWKPETILRKIKEAEEVLEEVAEETPDLSDIDGVV